MTPAPDSATRSLIRYAPPAPMEARPEDFDLSSGFKLIRRRLFSIVLLTILLTAAFVPTIMGLKPVYHAESRLMIRSSLATTIHDPGQGEPIPLDLPSEIERLLSRNISQRVVQQLKLADRAEFNPPPQSRGYVSKAGEYLRSLIGTPSRDALQDDGIEKILQKYYGALTVRRDATSNVIQIGFDSQDPILAASVPNTLLGVYLDEKRSNDRSRLDATDRWVQQRVVEQQARVDAAREAVTRYREAEGPVSNEAQAGLVKAAADLDDRYQKVVQSRTDVAATIAALEAPGRDPATPDMALPDGIVASQREIRTQQAELDRLLQTFGESSEEIIGQRATIATMKASLRLELARYVETQRTKLANLDREASEIRDARVRAQDQLARSAVAQTELEVLLRTVEAEQAAFDRLEQQRRSFTDQAALPDTEVEILSPASVPLGPQGRGRLFFLLAALFGSISIAVTVAFIREMLDKTVRSHEQLEGIGGLVPAGLLPLTGRHHISTWSALGRSRSNGLFVEAIHSVMVSLRQSNGGRLPGSIIVTSAVDGEGKSFVARALAIEFAAARQPVLLVDADLARGNQGATFKSGKVPGLNEYLYGDADLEEVIQHHPASGIDFIARGDPATRERLYLPDLSRIIKHAQSKGQIVIIDCAPVLASTDPVYMAGQVERTLLVVRWAKTDLRAVDFAVQRLRSTTSSEITVAINKVNPRRHKLYGFKDAEMFAKSLQKYHGAAV